MICEQRAFDATRLDSKKLPWNLFYYSVAGASKDRAKRSKLKRAGEMKEAIKEERGKEEGKKKKGEKRKEEREREAVDEDRNSIKRKFR